MRELQLPCTLYNWQHEPELSTLPRAQDAHSRVTQQKHLPASTQKTSNTTPTATLHGVAFDFVRAKIVKWSFLL